MHRMERQWMRIHIGSLTLKEHFISDSPPTISHEKSNSFERIGFFLVLFRGQINVFHEKKVHASILYWKKYLLPEIYIKFTNHLNFTLFSLFPLCISIWCLFRFKQSWISFFTTLQIYLIEFSLNNFLWIQRVQWIITKSKSYRDITHLPTYCHTALGFSHESLNLLNCEKVI